MVDLDTLEMIAELSYPARAPIIREAIAELRERMPSDSNGFYEVYR